MKKMYLLLILVLICGCGNNYNNGYGNPYKTIEDIENYNHSECIKQAADSFSNGNTFVMLEDCKLMAELKRELPCRQREDTEGCNIVEVGHWYKINCHGEIAYYLPQMCHVPFKEDYTDYIFIDGQMFVWSYMEKDGEIIYTKPSSIGEVK